MSKERKLFAIPEISRAVHKEIPIYGRINKIAAACGAVLVAGGVSLSALVLLETSSERTALREADAGCAWGDSYSCQTANALNYDVQSSNQLIVSSLQLAFIGGACMGYGYTRSRIQYGATAIPDMLHLKSLRLEEEASFLSFEDPVPSLNAVPHEPKMR